MAALSGITAVRPTLSTKIYPGPCQYGATISAGQAVYRDPSDGKWKLSDANGGSSLIGSIGGIAITPGGADGYGIVAVSGSIILVGTTMTVGKPYYVGQTAGSLVPESDLATNDYVSKAGTAVSATEILLGLESTGVQRA